MRSEIGYVVSKTISLGQIIEEPLQWKEKWTLQKIRQSQLELF